MTYKRLILKNTLFLSVAEWTGKIFSFFWTIYLARILGVLVFGRYNIINSLVGLLLFLPDLGTNIIAIRQIAQDERKSSRVLGRLLVINFFFAWLAFFILMVIGLFSPFWQGPLLPFSLAAFTLVLSSLRTVAMVTFQSFERMDYVAIFNFFNIFTSIIFGFLGLRWLSSLSGLFGGVMIATVLMGVLAWLVVLNKFGRPEISFDLIEIKALLRQGLPLGLAAFFTLFHSKINTLILARFLGEAKAGIYASALVLVVTSIQFFNVPLVSAAFPTFSRLFKEDYQNFKNLIKTLLLVVVSWSLPLILIIWIFSTRLIAFFYGPDYQPAGQLLKNLIFIVPLASWSAILYTVLIAIDKQTVYFWINLAGSIVSVLAGLIFIPMMGMKGAVLANILTYSVLFCLYVHFTRLYLKS